MPVRLASPDEAEKLWEIRNQAIRHGCKNTYDEQVILAWTPDLMPPGYRTAVASNPFFVVDSPEGKTRWRPVILICKITAWKPFSRCLISPGKAMPAGSLTPSKLKRNSEDWLH